jgi:hypothetical protein
VTEPHASHPAASPQAEYDHLLSYFKYLVTLTTVALGLLIAIGAYLFHSNMKDVREDAKQEATRVATSEAKAGVAEAFDEKNINATILLAAQQEVGKVTDRLIEQQLNEKLRPVQQRISFVGQLSECEMRMRMGFRSGLDELNGLLKSTTDPDVTRFGKSTLATTSQDFDDRIGGSVKQLGVPAMQALVSYLISQHRPQQSLPANLHDVVQVINHEQDLNAVAGAFVAFRELTGASVKMFDFGAVESWCSNNQPKCKT